MVRPRPYESRYDKCYRLLCVLMCTLAMFASVSCGSLSGRRHITGLGGSCSLVLLHNGGPPRQVPLHVFIDGQEVKQEGLEIAAGRLRPIVREYRLSLAVGPHTISVEALGGQLTAERDFEITEDYIYIYIVYSSRGADSRAAHSGRASTLEIRLSGHPPGFA